MDFDLLNTSYDYESESLDASLNSDPLLPDSKPTFEFGYQTLTPPLTAHSSFILEDTALPELNTSIMNDMQDYPFMQQALSVPVPQEYAMLSQFNPGFPMIQSLYEMPLFTGMPQYNVGRISYPPSERTLPSKSLFAFDPLTHSATTPITFCCDSCPAVFKRNAELRRHTTSIHFAAKTYICGSCNTAFGRKDALKRHMTSRIPSKPCAGARRRSSKVELGFTQGLTVDYNMNYGSL